VRLGEWAKARGIHRDTAYRWFRAGLIPGARKIRHTIWIDVELSQLDRIEKKLDDLVHEVRRKNGA
jgi:predicted site-specific integrase-resolvase